MAKDPHARERKKKKQELRRREYEREQLAYSGTKYKSDHLARTWAAIETAVYKAYIFSDRTLTDQSAIKGLQLLVRQLEAGELAPVDTAAPVRFQPEEPESLLVDCIQRQCVEAIPEDERPTREEYVGVLRTMIGQAIQMKSGKQSVNYLRYVIRFVIEKLGVKVVMAPDQPIPSEEHPTR